MTRFLIGLILLGVGSVTVCSAESPAPDKPAAQMPVPADAALREAQSLVNEVYADDIAKAKRPEEKVALAKKMLKAAIDTKGDLAGRYVLLCVAKDLAAGAGNIETAFAAIAELEQYQTDTLALKVEVLTVISKSVRGQEAKTVIDQINPLIDEAIAVDRYDVAKQLSGMGASLARAARDLDSIKDANARVQEVQRAEVAYMQVKKALAVLADQPNDPDANLVVGRFYCFTKDEWEKGLPMLSLGSDSALKGLAEKELGKPTDADKQVEVADEWWALAGKETATTKLRMQERAGHWYEQALPNLTGLVKAKAEKRLAEVGPRELENLLKLVDIDRDTLRGTCKREGTTITISDNGRLRIPFTLEGDYELRIEVMRLFGGNDIQVSFPVGETIVTLVMSGWYGSASSLAIVDGLPWDKNKTTVRPGTLTNNKWYDIHVRVSGRGDAAEVLVELDGKRYIQWKGKQSELSSYHDIPKEVIKAKQILLSAAHDAVNVFKSVTVMQASNKHKPPPVRLR